MCVCVCLAVAGVRVVPPLRKPFKGRQDCRNQARVLPSLTLSNTIFMTVSHTDT